MNLVTGVFVDGAQRIAREEKNQDNWTRVRAERALGLRGLHGLGGPLPSIRLYTDKTFFCFLGGFLGTYKCKS